MSTDSEKKTNELGVLVSEDRLKAWLDLSHQVAPDFQPPTVPQMREALTAASIQIDERVETNLAQLAALVSAAPAGDGPPEIPTKYLVAEGTPPVEAVDAVLEWSPGLVPAEKSDTEADHVDYFALNSVKTVEAGTVVGRIQPPTEGVPGRDVCGNAVPPQRRRGDEISLGPGLSLGDNGVDIVASAPGRVVERAGTLLLEEALDIRGDVSFESGSVDVCIDVHVRGTVHSQFHVHTTKSLTVDKAIEAADIVVGGDVVVRGGICGGDAANAQMGRVQAGGGITARFTNEAILEANGVICFSKECIASVLRTPERIVSERGTIIGGYAWARNGIEVGTLGSDASVVTYVAVDIRPAILLRARAMENDVRGRRKSATLIRQKVQPLLANLKRLTAQQREMATELMAKADEMETGADALEAEREQMLTAARPTVKPSILVNQAIYPGVRFIWAEREARITRHVAGPVRLEERRIEGATELVFVNQQTASVTILPATDVDMEALPDDDPGTPQPTGGEHGPSQPEPHHPTT